MIGSLLRILLIPLLCVLAGTAVAQRHTVQLGDIKLDKEQAYFLSEDLYYFIDEESRFTAGELLGAEPLPQWLRVKDKYATVGNSRAPVWFYLDFFSGDVALSTAYMYVRHASLNNVDFFIYADGELLDTQHLSTSEVFSARKISQPTVIFPLAIEAQRRYQMLFRVQSSSVIDFPLYLHTPESLVKVSSQHHILEGLYFGMVIIMVLYNLFIFLSTRDLSYLFYICFVASLSMVIGSIEGTGYQYLWPNFPAFNPLAVSTFSAGSVLFGTLFTTTFLGVWRKGNWLSHYFSLLVLASSVCLVLTLLRVIDFSLQLAAVLTLMSYPMFLLAGILAWREGHIYAKYFTIAWLALCMFVILLSTAAIGIFNLPIEELWPLVRYGSAAEMILLSLALAAKINDVTTRERAARDESAAKSDFIAQLSHELRTPMNGVLGMSELLRDRLNDETSRHYNSVIYQSGLALLGVINDVLDMAKIDVDKLEIEQIAFDLHALMEEALCVIEPQALEKSIQLRCDIDAAIPQWVMGDPHRIKQIVFNFLSNANKFTEQGAVVLSLQPGRSADDIQISVCDTGIGIADEKLEDMFLPYSQASSSTARHYGGTGLGLYICQRLSVLMGGDIWVKKNQPCGSIFSVSLPLPACKPVNAFKPSLAKGEGGESYNVLVAEDNDINQTIIKKMLEKLGHDVTLAHNGVEAVALAKKQVFHLILMDCEMPQMDGYEATQEIRKIEQQQQLPRTPIIAVTAHAIKSYRDQALASGMDGVVTKPLKLEVLQQNIASFVRPKS